MNKDRPLNGEKHNNFPLVRRPSSAVEKAAPGAKRILSGMVADTLALIPERVNAETEGWVKKGNSYFASATRDDNSNSKSDYIEAVKWYRKAAERGNAKAQCFLGHCYVYGSGVAEDEVEAVKWFHKSAESGYANAQRWLGDFYERTQDYISAIKWYRKGAEQGDFSCQHTLGDFYHDGKGVSQSYAEAVKWYRKAADQNLSTAQCTLGCCYRDGQGVTQDFGEAVKWYRMSAEDGWAMAQYNLGLCYADGKGVPQDYQQAVHWYRKAAEQGFSDAEESLGACYANGRAAIDVKDAVEIYKWVKIAEEKEYDGAAKTVSVISALLSPEELREAERRYQELCSRKNQLYERVKEIINNG
jgi:TPR repeat protein